MVCPCRLHEIEVIADETYDDDDDDEDEDEEEEEDDDDNDDDDNDNNNNNVETSYNGVEQMKHPTTTMSSKRSAPKASLGDFLRSEFVRQIRFQIHRRDQPGYYHDINHVFPSGRIQVSSPEQRGKLLQPRQSWKIHIGFGAEGLRSRTAPKEWNR